jgi:hypothetical protein
LKKRPISLLANIRRHLSLSQTSSGWQLIENQATLL